MATPPLAFVSHSHFLVHSSGHVYRRYQRVVAKLVDTSSHLPVIGIPHDEKAPERRKNGRKASRKPAKKRVICVQRTLHPPACGRVFRRTDCQSVPPPSPTRVRERRTQQQHSRNNFPNFGSVRLTPSRQATAAWSKKSSRSSTRNNGRASCDPVQAPIWPRFATR